MKPLRRLYRWAALYPDVWAAIAMSTLAILLLLWVTGSIGCRFHVLESVGKAPSVPVAESTPVGTKQNAPNATGAIPASPTPSLWADPTVHTALGGLATAVITSGLVIWDRKRRIASGQYNNGKH